MSKIRMFTIAGLVATPSSMALAQEAPPPVAAPAVPDGEASVPDIIVTGSRLVTDPLKAPTPLTTITAEESQLAKPGNAIESLIMLPRCRHPTVAVTRKRWQVWRRAPRS